MINYKKKYLKYKLKYLNFKNILLGGSVYLQKQLEKQNNETLQNIISVFDGRKFRKQYARDLINVFNSQTKRIYQDQKIIQKYIIPVLTDKFPQYSIAYILLKCDIDKVQKFIKFYTIIKNNFLPKEKQEEEQEKPEQDKTEQEKQEEEQEKPEQDKTEQDKTEQDKTEQEKQEEEQQQQEQQQKQIEEYTTNIKEILEDNKYEHILEKESVINIYLYENINEIIGTDRSEIENINDNLIILIHTYLIDKKIVFDPRIYYDNVNELEEHIKNAIIKDIEEKEKNMAFYTEPNTINFFAELLNSGIQKNSLNNDSGDFWILLKVFYEDFYEKIEKYFEEQELRKK